MNFQKRNKKDAQNISAPFFREQLRGNVNQVTLFVRKACFFIFLFTCHFIYTMAQNDQIVTKNKMQDDYYQIYEKAKFYQKRADSTLKITQMLREELLEEKDPDKRNLLEKRILKSEQQHTEYLTNANTYYKRAAFLKNNIDLSNQENRVAETNAYSDAFYKLPPIGNLLSTDEWESLYELEPSALTANKFMAEISNLKDKKNELTIVSSTTQSPGEKEKLRTQIENLDSEIEEKEK